MTPERRKLTGLVYNWFAAARERGIDESMANVILHRPPGDDELIEIDLPPDVAIGHTFRQADGEWTIVGERGASETEVAVTGTSAWLAAPRPHADPPTQPAGPLSAS
jgi:hypothetical protein